MKDEQASQIMAGIIKISLLDLYHEKVTAIPPKVKDPKKYLKEVNIRVERLREDAMLFFKKSDLFKYTKLDLVYLLTKYEETLKEGK